AKHLSTLYLEDLSDFIVECVDENFGFSRYAERLGESANSFDELYAALNDSPTKIDEITLAILDARIKEYKPKLICFSVPFPGNLYSAFRCAQWVKAKFPAVKIAMGGGFPNTELRSLKDKRVCEFFDYITLDDGELPIELVYKNVVESESNNEFKRTYILQNEQLEFVNNSIQKDYKQSEVGTPDYSDLLWSSYISVIQIANPMHSLWSDGRWLKLTMAHGCYWGKCTFCDISLDYIKLYEPIAAKLLVDRMEELMEATGENGFHFVDEAAPPSLMKALALEILRRDLIVSWWTNIRFEKNFTKDLCVLLKSSGCIAVSGGLEVASDRLLTLIDKGTSVSQVANVTRNLTDSGIMVHAYLMYGYPTQTIQETIDSLEMVRQLFESEILQSGFWHQFALTAHSPVGLNPQKYGVLPKQNEITFANNDIQFTDLTGIDHSRFSYGLKKSLYNFMQGVGLDLPLHDWFEFKIPKTTISKNFIQECLAESSSLLMKETSKLVWIESLPIVKSVSKTKRGVTYDNLQLTFHSKTSETAVMVENEKGLWLYELLKSLHASQTFGKRLNEVRASYEERFIDFDQFWYSKPILKIRELGLLVL
ncbi:MAG: radical SAM protein, partial [Bacteroidetes bacterium]|nr:radical SAM protein [Bacteroidota bacterium]